MNNKPAFKTLAFIDLETTGLPAFEFNKTKITQLTIIACSVEHIENLKSKNDIPRVLHKLSLCFNPWKMIKIKVIDITGLSNELLEHERKFDENAADLISNFLIRLQQPVVLVAHNGNRFDYPVLKKHLNILNKSLPPMTKCCDSLEIFRKIDEISEDNSKVLINDERLTSLERIKDEPMPILDLESGEINSVLINCKKDEEAKEHVDKLEAEYFDLAPESDNENKKIGELDEIKARQILNETTPNKPTKAENKMPISKARGEMNGTKRSFSNINRELFPDNSTPSTSDDNKNSKEERKFRKGYKLIDIYKRHFGEEPKISHDSEADVMNLLKCVVACKKEFLELAQIMISNFCDVKGI